MPEFKIDLTLDRTRAQQAIQETIRDLKGVEDAARKASEAMTRGGQQGGDAVAKAAKGASAAHKQATADATEAGKAMGGMGQAGTAGFGQIAAGAGIAAVGVGKLVEVVQGLGKAIKDAAEKSRELGKSFADQRDKLAELATIQGVGLDNKFTLGFARYQAQTGFRADEALKFQTQLYNTGAQFKGRNITDQQFEAFNLKAGQLAIARGLDPNIGGDLAGRVLGFSDFKKFGQGASDEATARLNRGLAILGRGSGDNAILARQANQLAAGSLSEDELSGVFQNFDEVATVISVMAEKNQSQAEVMARASIRGLRAFDDKVSSPLLERAGIKPGTKYFDAVKLLAAQVNKEVQERQKLQPGIKVQDVLQEYFHDIRTSEALSVLVNAGVNRGVIEDRTKFAEGFQGQGPVKQTLEEFRKSEAGRLRIEEADVNLANLERGAERSKIDVIRQQALAQLIRERKIDTTTANMQDFLHQRITFGLLETGHQQRIDERVGDILKERAKGLPEGLLGMKPKGMFAPFTTITEEDKIARFNTVIAGIEKAGRDPLGDMKEALDANTKAVQEQNDLMKAAQAPKAPNVGPPAVMPPMAPPPAKAGRP